MLYFIINTYELFGSAVCQENFVRRADPRLNWTPPAGCLTFNEEILEHPGAAPGALAIENLDFNEFQAVTDEIGMAVSKLYPVLSKFRAVA